MITEVLQASFLVADDVMDQGEKRRGFDCWYRTQSPLSDGLLWLSFWCPFDFQEKKSTQELKKIKLFSFFSFR